MQIQEIERKWRKYWEDRKIFKSPDSPRSKKKYYDLVMFAYPSGDIHIGHFRNYTIGDLLARYKKMKGFEVMHPFGWDAFGLPAEEAAIKHNIHPREWTLKNIEVSRATLKRLGICYDWDREVITCLPEYYRWNQWIFLKMFEKGLAYQAESLVNWCPKCQTVLANEQVVAGQCWRCDSIVAKKTLLQWFLKITAYAERLLSGLDLLEGWPEHVKTMQRNWIGKSEGAKVAFILDGDGGELPVFTTRPDTLFGVTFAAIAPEHPGVRAMCRGLPQEKEVLTFIDKTLRQSEIERTALGEKSGVFTGRYCFHPFSGEKIPLWVGDYVLAGYGTGMVMGVPAHDQRDFLFAKKYNLPIKVVIQPEGEAISASSLLAAHEGPGIMVNSAEFDGFSNIEAIQRITGRLKEKNRGDFEVRYKLRDWLISRQRYWGTPIPVIHCGKCGLAPVPYEELPVKLPEGKIDFIPKGRSPLEDVKEFIETTCPKCGDRAKRDPDTMDTFVDSSWYFLRYLDSKNEKIPFEPSRVSAWLPVDQYVGGVEHATMHLVYFRFFTKVLHDLGFLSVEEPALALFNQGMVLDRRGQVMSKSKGNAVSPADLMDKVGADVCRIAVFFAAPADKEILWSDEGVGGAQRFLARVVRFVEESAASRSSSLRSEKVFRKLHQTIKKVSDDIDRFSFHTGIAALMELLNLIEEEKPAGEFARECAGIYVRLLAPYAPHLAEELWDTLGNPPSIFESSWPLYDEKALEESQAEIVVQVNGKVKDHVTVSASAADEEVKKSAMSAPKVKDFLTGKTVKKVVVVPKKLVNIVTG